MDSITSNLIISFQASILSLFKTILELMMSKTILLDFMELLKSILLSGTKLKSLPSTNNSSKHLLLTKDLIFHISATIMNNTSPFHMDRAPHILTLKLMLQAISM
jgi:hypothetical protein